jgi:hypothetical protein
MAVMPSDSSDNNILNQLQNNFFNVQDKYKVLVEYDSSNDRVKWNGNFENLKTFVADLFGEQSKWISPGGRAKSFRSSQVSITWYPLKKSLVFQGQAGIKLKDLIIGLAGSNMAKDCGNITPSGVIDQENFDQLAGNVTNIELSVKQIGVAMNKLDKDFHLMANYIKDRDRNLRDTTRDIGVQTDFNLVSEMRAQSQTVCSVSHSELSTELEGAKLDIVLMESKIVCGFLTNTQKMEQIRVELVDQNKALSSKVEALELDLKTCKLNLHELEQRNTINYLNQQCGSITPKGDRSINSQIAPNNNTNVEAKINYANSHTFNQRKEINQETKRNYCELPLDQSCIVVEDQSTDTNLSKRSRNLNISHIDWEHSDPSNLIDVIQDHHAKINEGKTYANVNIACQEPSLNPGRRVPWSQQVSKQNEDRCGPPTIISNTLHQIPQHDLTNQYSIPTRITSREKIQSQNPNWQRDKHSTKTCQAKEVFRKSRRGKRKDKMLFFQYYY